PIRRGGGCTGTLALMSETRHSVTRHCPPEAPSGPCSREACMPRLPLLLLGLLLGCLTACASVGVHAEAQGAFDHGLRLFHRGQYAEAIPLLQEATQLDPTLGQ